MSQNILLIQLYSNGDCLYATAVARQIKQDYPGCNLTWAVASFCKQIIAHNPYVDDVLEVSDVFKNDVIAYRRFKRRIHKQREEGKWDEVFITNIIDDRQSNYDGCIRSAIFHGYPGKITVPVQPVLQLSAEEIHKASEFAIKNRLGSYHNVILFEFAPQSGQSSIDVSFAMKLAEAITKKSSSAVILSSAAKIEYAPRGVIDGSLLSLRETAALTHYCNFLIGCSSGITWISTSDAAKPLPMIQLLNPNTTWVNAVSRDFKRFGIDDYALIELTRFDLNAVEECLYEALNDFPAAKRRFNQPIHLHFRTTRNIVYNLLCYLHFAAIWKHININVRVYGYNGSFFKEVIIGLVIFPFRLIKNLLHKRILKRG